MKLNTAKSKFSQGPVPKSRTVVISQDGDWIVQNVDSVDAEGKAETSITPCRRACSACMHSKRPAAPK